MFKKMIIPAVALAALGGCAAFENLGEVPSATVEGIKAALIWAGKFLFNLILGWLGLSNPVG